MIKIKCSLLCFSILLLANCSAYSQVKQEFENNIDKYLDMSIALSQDTVSYGDEIVLTVIFKNKSDSCVSFYPRAILIVDIYYPSIRIYEAGKGRLLTEPPFYENLITLPPLGIHKEMFILKVDEPLFSKKLIIRYICAKGNNKHRKNNKEGKSNILFGRLYSDPFEINIKK